MTGKDLAHLEGLMTEFPLLQGTLADGPQQVLGSPGQIYSKISTADIEFPEITLSSGETVTVTPGQYSNILSTYRNQEDRRKAFEVYENLVEIVSKGQEPLHRYIALRKKVLKLEE